MLAKGLYNKKSASVSMRHMGWPDTWENRDISQHSHTSFNVGNACIEDAFYFLSITPSLALTPGNFLLLIFHCDFATRLLVRKPQLQGCFWKQQGCLVSLLHTVLVPFPARPGGTFASPQGWTNSKYLTLPCGVHFSDSGVAGNIGNLHPFRFCKTQPVMRILVHLSRMTSARRGKTKPQLPWNELFETDLSHPEAHHRMDLSI